MATHTARLIFTILFLIFAISGLVKGFWLSALFWALIAMAVGYPFIRGGRLNLNYDDTPAVVFLTPAASGAQTGAPQVFESLGQM